MPLFKFSVWLLGTVLSFTPAGAPSNLPKFSFPLIFNQKVENVVAQKNGILYIAGGWMQYSPPYENRSGPSSYALWMHTLLPFPQTNNLATGLDPVLRLLDVSKNFQTSLSAEYVRTEVVREEVPVVADAAFFPTESGLDLAFGIWRPCKGVGCGRRDPPIEDKKWQYDISNKQWTNTDITLKKWFQRNSPRRVSSSMTAWIPSLRKGFLFGGIFVSINETSFEVTELEEHNGLLTYDQAIDTWANETMSFGGIAEGGIVPITTATDEVLVQLGGRTRLASNIRPFSEINIYSTRKSKWYTQNLPSGAVVPTPRFAFCTAVKSASDNSSHQIYIMGGLEGSSPVNARGGPTTASVWVLSIPNFEWALLPVASKTTAADPGARITSKCQVIGEHYIFQYGGRKSTGYFDAITCDEKANAAFLLDVNTLEWTDKFTPNEGTYEIPSKVLDLIGGDKNGGSTKKAPANGWSDPDLETIMALKTEKPNPPTGSPSGSSSISGSSKTNVGTIAGGTVAGVLAVLLVLLGVMMLRRRHLRRRSQLPPGPNVPVGPLELMEHSQVNRGGVLAAELHSGEVAWEMDTGHRNG
ncbi:hypothetical protein HOY80DRAFT_1078462 [Tuber brumale]|nr:hypothetical protein HOY80DRAFT_1078462 [Tuber brumale]